MPGSPSSAIAQREQELDVAAAAALAAHRDGRLAAREQHARRRERLAVQRDVRAPSPAMHLADVARLAFDRVAEDGAA